jgi:hypothetical protein
MTIQVQRVPQVTVHEKGRPSYVADLAMFVIGSNAFPMVMVGMTPEEQDEVIAERYKELSNAARNTVQATRAETPKTGPQPLAN